MKSSVEAHQAKEIVFDYTSFLSVLCHHRPTLWDAFKVMLPALEFSWGRTTGSQVSKTERLTNQALKVLSTNTSDVNNLIRLLRLARLEQIFELDVCLPYSLDKEQLALIQEKAECDIREVGNNGEQLHIRLAQP
ncbi:hypothetical protein L4174_008040 [Photobacterium sp. CCB-ST2H9]|uniref:hypothetical protein n=1 Tax=unclassified Photobacterium TaxID=2628852 RepID=UPI00200429CD|nr:hypothetical protein [Photobacterium sp. CCB-ST2H9]UTM58766.1 hypothetical protein L4174_008040 [Photobacterium sp. CCB-ST2H9]